jgi:hypothetical protein
MLYLLAIDPEVAFTYIGLCILSVVITGLIIRWAVRADSVVKNQQAMIWFMILMCKKQGASDEEIKNIKDYFHIQ